MAKFGISGATVGYDKSNVKTMMKQIKANMITKAADELKKGRTELNNAVDAIWAGESATVFKNNLKSDTEQISKALNESYSVLESTVNSIVNEMSKVDKAVVKKRS